MTNRVGRPPYHAVNKITQRFSMAMANWSTIEELRMNLFAAVVVTINEMSEDERAEMMKHVDSVRVLR